MGTPEFVAKLEKSTGSLDTPFEIAFKGRSFLWDGTLTPTGSDADSGYLVSNRIALLDAHLMPENQSIGEPIFDEPVSLVSEPLARR